MLDGVTAVYKSNVDLFFYVVGAQTENEVLDYCSSESNLRCIVCYCCTNVVIASQCAEWSVRHPQPSHEVRYTHTHTCTFTVSMSLPPLLKAKC